MITVVPVPKLSEHMVIIPSTDLEKFKEMVHRGTNLWPDAPPEIKHFADNITHEGKIMQDYFGNPHLAGKVLANQSDKQY